MTWLLPSALGLAAAAIVATIALHFIARSRPVAEPLPTARFIPRKAVHARMRSFAPSDLLLLVLRVAALAAIGAAVAGPMLASRGRITRVFVVDRSRAVANIDEARDSVKRLAGLKDLVVSFDSAAVRVGNVAALDTTRGSSARGSLSAAIAAGIRAGVVASTNADSVELVVVSPFVREEIDDATTQLRASWPGRIRVMPVRVATAEMPAISVDAGTNTQDAVVAGLALAGRSSRGASIRLVRDQVNGTDSAWARGAGHVLLHWPATDSSAGWARRQTIDAIGAVATANAVLVGRFPRPWVMTGRAIARWADGEPAVVDHEIGEGCIRDVGILIDDASDVTLSAAFRRFAARLLAPCGGIRDLTSIDPAARQMLAGSGSLAPAIGLRDRAAESSRWSPWLLALAAVLLIVELAARRAIRSAA